MKKYQNPTERAAFDEIEKQVATSWKSSKLQLRRLERRFGDNPTFQQEVNLRNAKMVVINLYDTLKSLTNLNSFLQ